MTLETDTPAPDAAAKPSAKDAAKGVIADVAVGAAFGAVKGGGIPGAVAGAGQALLKNRTTRKLILGAIAVPIVITVTIAVTVTMTAMFSVETLAGADQKGSLESVASSGTSATVSNEWIEAVNGTGVQWTVAMAVDRQKPMGAGDARRTAILKLASAMQSAGLDLSSNDIAVGGVWAYNGRTLGTDSVEAGAAAANKAKFIAAFQGYGLSSSQADAAFTQGLAWELGQQSGCGSDATDVSQAATSGTSLTTEQQQNANTIIGVAKTLYGSNARLAAVDAIAVALQESGLVNLDHGDNAVNPDGTVADSLGLFQQQSSWGTAAQRTDPAYAAGKFFQRMSADPDWPTATLEAIVKRVQVPAASTLPLYDAKEPTAENIVLALYQAAEPVALPDAVGAVPNSTTSASPTGTPTASATDDSGSLSVCGDLTTTANVSADAKALATALAADIDSGKLTFWYQFGPGSGDTEDQIRWAAAGTSPSNCAVHTGILQVLTLAIQTFGSVQVNSLNRLCDGGVFKGVGSINGTHAELGGGWAVDIGKLGNETVNGSDPADLKFLRLLDSIPVTGGPHLDFGQSECRTGVTFTSASQFNDFCTHQHIDVDPPHDTVLTMSGGSSGGSGGGDPSQ